RAWGTDAQLSWIAISSLIAGSSRLRGAFVWWLDGNDDAPPAVCLARRIDDDRGISRRLVRWPCRTVQPRTPGRRGRAGRSARTATDPTGHRPRPWRRR